MIVKHRNNLTKKEIVRKIKSEFGTSTTNLKLITDELIESIIEILIEKKKINIKNFGSFHIIFKNERIGRNPKTKEEIKISARNSISFKPSDNLKNKLNEF